jgi:hypothetical protein
VGNGICAGPPILGFARRDFLFGSGIPTPSRVKSKGVWKVRRAECHHPTGLETKRILSALRDCTAIPRRQTRRPPTPSRVLL